MAYAGRVVSVGVHTCAGALSCHTHIFPQFQNDFFFPQFFSPCPFPCIQLRCEASWCCEQGQYRAVTDISGSPNLGTSGSLSALAPLQPVDIYLSLAAGSGPVQCLDGFAFNGLLAHVYESAHFHQCTGQFLVSWLVDTGLFCRKDAL